MVFRIDQHYSLLSSETKILIAFLEHGHSLGAGELSRYTGLNIDTISPNCEKLIKKGVLYDRPNQKGKYRLVDTDKLPTFLNFRSRNRTVALQTINDIFSSMTKQKDLEQFSTILGIYIIYVLIERTNPKGPWTANRFKTKVEDDPRVKDIDLLQNTWLADILDPNFLIEQFDKYINNNNQSYQELLQTFEFKFPDIYKKIVFHEQADKRRMLRKNEKKNKIKSDYSLL